MGVLCVHDSELRERLTCETNWTRRMGVFLVYMMPHQCYINDVDNNVIIIIITAIARLFCASCIGSLQRSLWPDQSPDLSDVQTWVRVSDLRAHI